MTVQRLYALRAQVLALLATIDADIDAETAIQTALVEDPDDGDELLIPTMGQPDDDA